MVVKSTGGDFLGGEGDLLLVTIGFIGLGSENTVYKYALEFVNLFLPIHK